MLDGVQIDHRSKRRVASRYVKAEHWDSKPQASLTLFFLCRDNTLYLWGFWCRLPLTKHVCMYVCKHCVVETKA